MKQRAIHLWGSMSTSRRSLPVCRDESGKVVMKATVPTEEKAIVALVGTWPRVHVAFEEGTQAQWLHDLLQSARRTGDGLQRARSQRDDEQE